VASNEDIRGVGTGKGVEEKQMDMQRRSVYDLLIGETNQILEFGDLKTARLLAGMGLGVGKPIKCVHRSGISVITSNGRTIAIDPDVAKRVYVM
jgi:hypothetical protein